MTQVIKQNKQIQGYNSRKLER